MSWPIQKYLKFPFVANKNIKGINGHNLNSISVGIDAGHILNGDSAIAIGNRAGYNSQGNNAIAIGSSAGETNQTANSIILNATGTALNASTLGLFISPLRGNINQSNVLGYNTTTNEVTYYTLPSIPSLNDIYPIGFIIATTTSTTPTIGGFTWVSFANDRILIGKGTTFSTGGVTGGSTTKSLSTANLPPHNHSAITSVSINDPGHSHTLNQSPYTGVGNYTPPGNNPPIYYNNAFTNPALTGITATATTSIGNTGSGSAFDVMNPYIVVYYWTRTA